MMVMLVPHLSCLHNDLSSKVHTSVSVSVSNILFLLKTQTHETQMMLLYEWEWLATGVDLLLHDWNQIGLKSKIIGPRSSIAPTLMPKLLGLGQAKPSPYGGGPKAQDFEHQWFRTGEMRTEAAYLSPAQSVTVLFITLDRTWSGARLDFQVFFLKK